MDRKKVDPALREELKAATKAKREVEAVFVLSVADSSVGFDSPDETLRKGHAVVERVRKRTGQKPQQVNVFENLQSMMVRADPKFIEKLIEEPEIGGATTNGSRST